MNIIKHVVLYLLLTFTHYATANSKVIDASDYGDSWPLRVKSGDLSCRPPGAVVFTHDDVSYAVNGMAKGLNGIKDIHPIWRADDTYPDFDFKMNLGPLIDDGLSLCK